MEEYLKTVPKPGRQLALLLNMDDFHKINEALVNCSAMLLLMNVARH